MSSATSIYTDLVLRGGTFVEDVRRTESEVSAALKRMQQNVTIPLGVDVGALQASVDSALAGLVINPVTIPVALDTSDLIAQQRAIEGALLTQQQFSTPAGLAMAQNFGTLPPLGTVTNEALAAQASTATQAWLGIAPQVPPISSEVSPTFVAGGYGPQGDRGSLLSSPRMNGEQVIYGSAGVGELYQPVSVTTPGETQPHTTVSAPAVTPAADSAEPRSTIGDVYGEDVLARRRVELSLERDIIESRNHMERANLYSEAAASEPDEIRRLQLENRAAREAVRSERFADRTEKQTIEPDPDIEMQGPRLLGGEYFSRHEPFGPRMAGNQFFTNERGYVAPPEFPVADPDAPVEGPRLRGGEFYSREEPIGPRMAGGQFRSMEGQTPPPGAREDDSFVGQDGGYDETAGAAMGATERMANRFLVFMAIHRAISAASNVIMDSIRETEMLQMGGVTAEDVSQKIGADSTIAERARKGIRYVATLGGLLGQGAPTSREIDRAEDDAGETTQNQAVDANQKNRQMILSNRQLRLQVAEEQAASDPNAHERRLSEIGVRRQREGDRIFKMTEKLRTENNILPEQRKEQEGLISTLTIAADAEQDRATNEENIRFQRPKQRRSATDEIELDREKGETAEAERKQVRERVHEESQKVFDEAGGGNEGINAQAHWMRDVGKQEIVLGDDRIKREQVYESAQAEERANQLTETSAEDAMRAKGQIYEADTAHLKAELDKQVRMLQERKDHETNIAKRDNIETEIVAAKQYEKEELVIHPIAVKREDELAAGAIQSRTQEVEQETRGDVVNAREEYRVREAERKAKELELAGKPKEAEAVREQAKAENAGDDERERQKYHEIGISTAQNALRAVGRNDQANLLGLENSIMNQQREAGNDPNKRSALAEEAKSEIAVFTHNLQMQSMIAGVSSLDAHRQIEQDIIEHPDRAATLKMARDFGRKIGRFGLQQGAEQADENSAFRDGARDLKDGASAFVKFASGARYVGVLQDN